METIWQFLNTAGADTNEFMSQHWYSVPLALVGLFLLRTCYRNIIGSRAAKEGNIQQHRTAQERLAICFYEAMNQKERWNWNPQTAELTFSTSGKHTLKILWEKTSINCDRLEVKFFAGGEDCSTVIYQTKISHFGYNETNFDLARNLKQEKEAEIEETRISGLLKKISPDQAKEVRWPTVGACNEELMQLLSGEASKASPSDQMFADEIYSHLIRLLKAERFTSLLTNPNAMTDNKHILFATGGPNDVKILVDNVTIMAIMSPVQRKELARICYEIASAHKGRNTMLTSIVSILQNISA